MRLGQIVKRRWHGTPDRFPQGIPCGGRTIEGLCSGGAADAVCLLKLQARILNRKLSLPVLSMSQRYVSRLTGAVVILASPRADSHFPNARWVATMLDRIMTAHPQEAVVVGAALAYEDRIDRCSHVVADAARTGAPRRVNARSRASNTISGVLTASAWATAFGCCRARHARRSRSPSRR